jgi:micrococcal nuclease
MNKVPGRLSGTWKKQGSLGKVILLSALWVLVCAPCACWPPPVPTATLSPSPEPANTSTPSPTHTSPPTATLTFTPAPTDTPLPTATSTHTPEPTDTPLPTATPTNTLVPTDTPTATPERTVASVLEVLDGDTIQVGIEGQTYTLRYAGIDTSEPGEPFGDESAAANRQLVQGKTVALEKDVSETDKYGRLVRYVWVGDTMVNAELVRLGYAHASMYPPDVRYHDLFLKLESEAREAGRGLWATQPQPATAAPGTAAVCDCSYNRYNCKDFATHADAQACFDYCWGQRGFDVHRLDGDGDGSACESLP